MSGIHVPRDGEHAESENKDLYDLYVDFERRFLQWSIAISSVEWVQLYYRRSFQLRSRQSFDRWIAGMHRRERAFYRRRWEEGFDEWLRKEHERDQKLWEHIRKHGIPRRIQKMVEEMIEEFEEATGRKLRQKESEKE